MGNSLARCSEYARCVASECHRQQINGPLQLQQVVWAFVVYGRKSCLGYCMGAGKTCTSWRQMQFNAAGIPLVGVLSTPRSWRLVVMAGAGPAIEPHGRMRLPPGPQVHPPVRQSEWRPSRGLLALDSAWLWPAYGRHHHAGWGWMRSWMAVWMASI